MFDKKVFKKITKKWCFMVIWLKKGIPILWQVYILLFNACFLRNNFPQIFLKKNHTPSLIFHEYFSVFVIQEDGSVFYGLASDTLFSLSYWPETLSWFIIPATISIKLKGKFCYRYHYFEKKITLNYFTWYPIPILVHWKVKQVEIIFNVTLSPYSLCQ